MKTLHLSDYAVMERPAIGWIVPKLIPKPGLVMLYGEPKAGKSFLALQLALAVGQGRSFANTPCVKGRVLYLQFDTGELVWRDRLQNLKKHRVDLSGDVYMVHPDYNPRSMNVLEPTNVGFLQDVLAETQPDMVIIDVLREVHNQDENDSTAMKLVGDRLMELFSPYALVILHHTHKLSPDSPPRVVNAGRGSSYVAGKADALWLIHDSKLKIESRFTDAMTKPMQRDSSGIWKFVNF